MLPQGCEVWVLVSGTEGCQPRVSMWVKCLAFPDSASRLVWLLPLQGGPGRRGPPGAKVSPVADASVLFCVWPSEGSWETRGH